ncbi:MAG: MaoC/PaaZ C-terminal domain-containing protein [Candidatus Hydrogenedentota bacterium]
MELTSQFTGLHARPLVTEITGRRAMGYAAAIGDANPRYFDDERPAGIVAPPMLAVALTWQMAADFANYWDVKEFPVEVLTRQVHYTEVLHWYRPMCPGDKLSLAGEVAAITPQRMGAYLVIRFDAVNQNEERVFTEFIGGLLRDVRCTDGGRGGDLIPMPERAPAHKHTLWQEDVHIDVLAPWVYDHCADIHFPIHSSVAFAHAVGLPGPIYQGTATLAHAVKAVLDREAQGDPARLQGVACRFTDMVRPGEDIRIEALVREPGDGLETIHFQVLNAGGRKAVRDGAVTLRNP